MLSQEEKEMLLTKVEPCQLFWDCYFVTDDGLVFSCNDETGQSAEEVYQHWLELKANPPAQQPSKEELLQAQIEELQEEINLKNAQIQALNATTDFHEDLIAEMAMIVYA